VKKADAGEASEEESEAQAAATKLKATFDNSVFNEGN
jgi:hypothetical protein